MEEDRIHFKNILGSLEVFFFEMELFNELNLDFSSIKEDEGNELNTFIN
jgi:hypothetical protein